MKTSTSVSQGPAPPPQAAPFRLSNPMISFERVLRRRLDEEPRGAPAAPPWSLEEPLHLRPEPVPVPAAARPVSPVEPPVATLVLERHRDEIAVRVTLREGPLEGTAIAVSSRPGGIAVELLPPPGPVTAVQGAELAALSRALGARGLVLRRSREGRSR